MRSRLVWMPAALLIWAGSPGRADAHLVNSGFGPFYDGVAHLFVTPEDLLVVVALALLAGLGGKPFGRAVLFVLPAAWLAGAVAGRMTAVSAGVPVLSAALLIALGGLVAADRRLQLALVAGAALACGLLNGCYNGAALAEAGSSGLAVAGIVCAVFVVVALVAGRVVSLEKEWARIVVRVAGSWIGAIGLLMLGWAVR
jgi:hydrogenase/urease accessory protein HupE